MTVTFTHPITYTNQDFDEYQTALKHLGKEHIEWYVQQPLEVRQHYLMGAWFANDLDSHAAYQCVDRWHGLSRLVLQRQE